MRASETRMQRVNTRAFVNAASVIVVLHPNGRIPDGAGGFILSGGADRPAQELRLLPQNVGTVVTTADGVERTSEYVLLGNYDAEMEVGDTFLVDGVKYEIASIFPFNAYERKARVIQHG